MLLETETRNIKTKTRTFETETETETIKNWSEDFKNAANLISRLALAARS